MKLRQPLGDLMIQVAKKLRCTPFEALNLCASIGRDRQESVRSAAMELMSNTFPLCDECASKARRSVTMLHTRYG